MIETIGWIGSILFALCGVPQAFKSIKDGNSDGLSWLFLLMWFFGELLSMVYAIHLKLWPLLFNYSFNFFCLLIVIYYRIWRRI